MYLLDTNVVSALRRSNHADANLLRWAARVRLAALFLSSITVLEIERGIMLIDRRDSAQATILRQWLRDDVLVDFAGRIFPGDVPVARRCAGLHVPDRRPERDAMIDPTALVRANRRDAQHDRLRLDRRRAVGSMEGPGLMSLRLDRNSMTP